MLPWDREGAENHRGPAVCQGLCWTLCFLYCPVISYQVVIYSQFRNWKRWNLSEPSRENKIKSHTQIMFSHLLWAIHFPRDETSPRVCNRFSDFAILVVSTWSNDLLTEAPWKVIQKCISTISHIPDGARRATSVQVNGGKHCVMPAPVGLPRHSVLARGMTFISHKPRRCPGAQCRCVCCVYKIVHYLVSNTKFEGSQAIVSRIAFVMKTQNTNLSKMTWLHLE